MPSYRVETEQGPMLLTLDAPPRDEAELRSLAEEAVAVHFDSDSGSPSQRRLAAGEPLVTGESAPPGFWSTLGTELYGGAKQMLQQAPTPGLADLGAAQGSQAGFADPSQFVNLEPPQAVIGALRIAGAVPKAAGELLGQPVLQATGSPIAATAANLVGQTAGAAGQGAALNVANRAVRATLPYLPGGQDALLRHGLERSRGEAAGLLEGRPTAEQLYSVVDQQNPLVAGLPNLKHTASTLAKNEQTLSQFGVESRQIINTADEITKTLKAGGGVPFQDARIILRRLGQRIDDLRDPLRQSTGSTEELGAMKQLYAGLLKDLETRTPKAARALVAANKQARREFAVRELSDVLDAGVRAVQGKGPQSINFGTMLNKLNAEMKKNELFSDAFAPGELEKIRDGLAKLSELPVALAPKGANFGFGRAAERGSVGGAAGAAIGGYAAGWSGAVAGAELGFVSSIAAAKVISSLLSSKGGRDFLYSITKNQPGVFFTPQGQALLSAAARANESADITEVVAQE